MAVDKLVDSTQLDSDLTSVANAIRTKGGTSSQLAFPAGFVTAIGNIPTGVTPTGTKQISITQNGTTTEDVTSYASAEITANVPNTYAAGDEGKVVSNGALVAQTSDTVTTNDTYDTTLISSLTVNVSGGGGGILLEDVLNRTVSGDLVLNVTGQPTPTNNPNGTQYINNAFNGLFQQVPGITSLTIRGLKWVPGQLMRMTGQMTIGTPAITSVSMPDAIYMGQRAFQSCTELVTASFPSMQVSYVNYTDNAANAFNDCRKLKTVELNVIDRIGSLMFNDCRVLEAVIIRKSNAVSTLVNVNAFSNTPLRGYGGTYSGHVYVPQDLIASYQAASNWATLYAAYPDIFEAIEGSDYE